MSISIFCETKFFTTIFFESSILMYGILNEVFAKCSFPKLNDLNIPSLHSPSSIVPSSDSIVAFVLKLKLYHEFNIWDRTTIHRLQHIDIIKKIYLSPSSFLQLRISLDLPSELFVFPDFKKYPPSQHLKIFDKDNY